MTNQNPHRHDLRKTTASHPQKRQLKNTYPKPLVIGGAITLALMLIAGYALIDMALDIKAAWKANHQPKPPVKTAAAESPPPAPPVYHRPSPLLVIPSSPIDALPLVMDSIAEERHTWERHQINVRDQEALKKIFGEMFIRLHCAPNHLADRVTFTLTLTPETPGDYELELSFAEFSPPYEPVIERQRVFLREGPQEVTVTYRPHHAFATIPKVYGEGIAINQNIQATLIPLLPDPDNPSHMIEQDSRPFLMYYLEENPDPEQAYYGRVAKGVFSCMNEPVKK